MSVSGLEGLLSDDNYLDVTDDIKVYEKGKTVKCPNCNQGFGLYFHIKTVKCPTCKKILVDLDWADRENQLPRGQQTIERWTQ